MKLVAMSQLSDGANHWFHCHIEDDRAEWAPLLNPCFDGNFWCKSLVAADDCHVCCVEASNDIDGVFV